MSPQQRSYRKTCIMAGAAAAVAIALIWASESLLHGPLRVVLLSLALLVASLMSLVAIAGVLVIWRDDRMAKGHEDLFLLLNEARSEAALRRATKRARHGFAPLTVGEEVQVKGLAEIQRTLDADGCLESLPFQAEMAAFCGRRFRVFRVVDKVYDYGRSRRLRRLQRTVSLAGVRCTGSAHGGCQAECSLLWKEDWLRCVAARPLQAQDTSALPAADVPVVSDTGQAFRCQFTQLTAASSALRKWDIRQDLRPLLSGNVTVPAYCVVLLTRLFNCVQEFRGGIGYPALSQGKLTQTPAASHGLVPGSRVRVLDPESIAATLDSGSRNRGLWFDQEMLRSAGRTYQVHSRVDRIIDITTCRVTSMKTPSFTLEGVTATGEFLRLCSQHEYNFWREAWLRPEVSYDSA